MDQVEEIKRKTDIVQVISEYTELKKAGRNYKGICPFHSEKTPSFMVSPELQIYKCFGCQAGGDVYKFLMDLERLDFPQVLKILADRAGIKLVQTKGFASFQEKDELFSLNFLAAEFYHYLLTKHQTGEKARQYLKDRGIGEEAIEQFKLGFSPGTPDAVFQFLTIKRGYKVELLEKAGIVVKSRGGYFDRFRGRIIFPLKDHFGNVCGFAGRVIDGKGDIAKYINSPETLVYKKSRILYGLDIVRQAIKRKGFVTVVEGEIDCISCWQAGVENVVAIKGSAFTEEQALLISRFTDKVILALDADFAGNEAAKRGLDILQKQALDVQIAQLGQYKDPDEMARENPEALKLAILNTTGVYDFLIGLVFKKVDVSTTEGKAKASRELSPILSRIEDEIVRASCLRTIAQRLGVPEDAVIAQMRKQPGVQRGFAQETSKPAPELKSRRDLLEEHLIAYVFQKDPQGLFDKSVKDLIYSPPKKRLIDEIQIIYNKMPQKYKEKGSSNLQYISDNLSPELRDFLSLIALSQIDLITEENVEKEIKQLKSEIELLDTREKMTELTKKIKSYETLGETSQVRGLEQELIELGQKLSSLEAQSA